MRGKLSFNERISTPECDRVVHLSPSPPPPSSHPVHAREDIRLQKYFSAEILNFTFRNNFVQLLIAKIVIITSGGLKHLNSRVDVTTHEK